MRTPREELAERSALGDVYLRRLVRTQLSLALVSLVAFGGIVGGAPLALRHMPFLQAWELAGVPVALWLMLAPLPFLVAVGWVHQRRADALDEAFAELLHED